MLRTLQLFVLTVAIIQAACGTGTIDRSPLATWTWDRNSEVTQVFPDARSEGTLDVSPSCVRLVFKDKDSVLLVWPEPTSWSVSKQAIDFVSVRDERREFRDGDRIVLGGARRHPTVSPNFVSAPDPSCEADGTFVLHSARMLTEED